MQKNDRFMGNQLYVNTSTVPWTISYGPDNGGVPATMTTGASATANAQTINLALIAGAVVILIVLSKKGK